MEKLWRTRLMTKHEKWRKIRLGQSFDDPTFLRTQLWHMYVSQSLILAKSRCALDLLNRILLLFSQAKQDFGMQKVQTFQEDKSLYKQTHKHQRVEHGVMSPTARSRFRHNRTTSSFWKPFDQICFITTNCRFSRLTQSSHLSSRKQHQYTLQKAHFQGDSPNHMSSGYSKEVNVQNFSYFVIFSSCSEERYGLIH